MKKPRKKNKLLSIFIMRKQIIFLFLSFLLLFIPAINTSEKGYSSKIIKFKIKGDITISDSTKDTILENKLNSPLIFTKLNEKNINFKDDNILPNKNGELNYIDCNQHITLLDISLEEFYANSPLIIKEYPNLLFISNRTMSLFAININNGFIYDLEYNTKDAKNLINMCPKNKNDVLFLRIDYFLHMKYTYKNNNSKDKFNDVIWHAHYIKIIPIYPIINMNTEFNQNQDKINANIENDDYYIFEVIENKNINLIYSQDKDIYMQVRDIQNENGFDYYYFNNNKRKHLFEYNITKKDEKKNLSIKFAKIFFLLIIIFALSGFSIKIYKSQVIINSYNNFIKNKKKEKNEIIELNTDLINKDKTDENNNKNIIVIQKIENQKEKTKSPRSKSISNLSTICSIENDSKQNLKLEINSAKNNLKFYFKKSGNSNIRKQNVKQSSSKTSLHQKRKLSLKKAQNIKHLFKNNKHYNDAENKELKELFSTYIDDIAKNTNESVINLNFNLSEDEEKYKKIFSLIKSEDSSSSEEINIKEQNQGFYAGELESNFLFYFDNGRLLKTYKDFEFIGKGGFGVVFKATNKIDESQCAIKVMKINLDLKEENEDLKVTQEIKTMLKFKKKNIVRYKTCWFEFNKSRAKKKRNRAMSVEQRTAPSNNFKEDFLEKGEKKIKKIISKHLKTPLERIQSISKELKLAGVNQKKEKRKSSVIWDSDDEESDADSLGANKNYAIKEEGDDKYIHLDDDVNEVENDDENSDEINDISENIKDEKEGDSNESEESNDSDNNNENAEKSDVDESNNNEIDNTNNNDNDTLNNKDRSNKDFSSYSNSKVKDDKERSNEDGGEYDNLRPKNYYNESSSKNVENTNSENFINCEKDSENNSIFEEEIKKEKEELKKQKDKEKNSSSISDDEDDLKNNSLDGLGISKQNKNKNKKRKKYPIYFFIQMEYCSGCPMNYYLSHRECVPSKKLTTYMLYQMCKAVKHIHEGNIIHRDLKPGNIFIIDNFQIKIGDFGLALNSKSTEYKQGGTYLYQSPEQINNEPYDEKIDIFALGVILVELVSKFNTEFERREILQGLKKSQYPEYLKEGHLKEYNLVKKMTTLNPKDRPNIKDIFKDNDFIDLINESLKGN